MNEAREQLDALGALTRVAYNLAAERYRDLFEDELASKEFDRQLLSQFAARFHPGDRILDAGCGPCAHIGRYLARAGLEVTGLDIAERCVEFAREANPGMKIERGDISAMPFADGSFDGIVSYYSIIDTPKGLVGGLLSEFHRVLANGGILLVAVKAGTTEGYVSELLEIPARIYVSYFTARELSDMLTAASLVPEQLTVRPPYPFEIQNDRIYAIARKT
jgi:ubiquinone/menaquinone biosynthesis C-methylase UbiE